VTFGLPVSPTKPLDNYPFEVIGDAKRVAYIPGDQSIKLLYSFSLIKYMGRFKPTAIVTHCDEPLSNMRWDPDKKPAGRRKTGWHHRPRWGTRTINRNSSTVEPPDGMLAVSPRVALDAWARVNPVRDQAVLWQEQYHRYARRLWSCDYTSELLEEKAEAPELWQFVTEHFASQTSSYRMRLTDPRLIERYDAKAEKQIRDHVSVLRRRKSAHVLTFSCMARSISYLNQKLATRVWADHQRGLKIGVHLV
jgi:hypothetical protein